jgi:hypothetical protein
VDDFKLSSALLGQYTAASFVTSADGSGGTATSPGTTVSDGTNTTNILTQPQQTSI